MILQVARIAFLGTTAIFAGHDGSICIRSFIKIKKSEALHEEIDVLMKAMQEDAYESTDQYLDDIMSAQNKMVEMMKLDNETSKLLRKTFIYKGLKAVGIDLENL